MADTAVISRDLFPSTEEDEDSFSTKKTETLSGGVKVIKEDRFGDALVIEDYDSETTNDWHEGKGKEIELQPRGKYAIDADSLAFAEAFAGDEEAHKARDSHQFQMVQFSLPGTYCDHCGTLIWGITGKQGMKCDGKFPFFLLSFRLSCIGGSDQIFFRWLPKKWPNPKQLYNLEIAKLKETSTFRCENRIVFSTLSSP